jgi:hypothetical protein
MLGVTNAPYHFPRRKEMGATRYVGPHMKVEKRLVALGKVGDTIEIAAFLVSPTFALRWCHGW